MKEMKVTDMQALGYFSLQVRKEKQKTLQDLADLTQFSKSQLSNFETGKVVNPSLLFIEKLGNALEFQLSEMIYLLMQIREIMREVDEKQKEMIWSENELKNWRLLSQILSSIL